MKTLRLFLVFALLAVASAVVSASETSDNFAKWVPDFASPDLNKQRDAQQQWQSFCLQQGNDSEIRKEIIRVSADQLAKQNPVDTSVWIVRQLGMVGDAAAVPVLVKCLGNSEVRVRDEAARALANIPGKEAEDALKNNTLILTSQLAKDALRSRAIKADIPKDNAVETQLPLAIPFLPRDNTEVATFLEGYSQLSDMEKAQVLSNLTARAQRMQIRFGRTQRANANSVNANSGNPRQGMRPSPYIPLALEAVKSSDETLRNAGLLAVGALGGTAEVPFLLEQARDGANKELAKVALIRMSRVGTLLVETLKSETDHEKFLILADILNRRYDSTARAVLLDKAKGADTPNRAQLLQLAESMSTQANIGDFVKAWALITDRGQKDQAEQIMARLSAGNAGAAMQALENWDTPDALSLLGRIGDPNTIDKIKPSKNAIRAWVNWPNARVADNLFAVAGNSESPEADQIAALRAFTRVMSLPNDQIGIRINDAEKVKRLADIYALAKRVEDKRLILDRVGQIRHVDSLRFVLKYFDDAELQERVCESILNLAHHVDLKRTARDEFNAALDKVLAVTQRNDFRDRANRYKGQQ